MTDPNYTHIAFLLDRSGSMMNIKSDTEGGFDAYIASQKGQPGRCTVTLAQFDNEYEELFSGLPIDAVPRLDLQPRGMTALNDSIARLVQSTGEFLAAMPEDERPGAVIVGIMTDGMENASKEWTRPAIKALIEDQESRYDWTFSYMGANQDAVEVGSSMGIAADRSLTYGTGAGNVAAAMDAYGASSVALRGAVAAGAPPASARATMSFSAAQRAAAANEQAPAAPPTPKGRRFSHRAR
jgi:hypothetical protein